MATTQATLPHGLDEPVSASAAERPSTVLRDRVRRAVHLLYRIIGAPDYEAYVAHVRRCHPDRAPLSRDDFVAQRLTDRYSTPGNRCC